MEYMTLINQALEACEKYEGRNSKFDFGQLKEYYQDDLLRTGYLIATMDGILDKMEWQMLCKTFGLSADEATLKSFYYEDVFRKNNFLQRIPKSIMYVLCEERKTMKDSFNIFLRDTRTLYKALKQYGYAVITCNSLSLPYQMVALEDMSKNILNVILSAEDMDVYFEEFDIGSVDVSITKIKTSPMSKDVMFGNAYQKAGQGQEFYDPYKNGNHYRNNFDLICTKENTGDTGSSYGAQDLGSANSSRSGSYGSSSAYTYSCNPNQMTETDKTSKENLTEILSEIDGMIGLDGVKKEVHNLVNILQVQKLRMERGLKFPLMSNHLVFTGNPGTGKTTVARKIAEIYKCLGILETGQLVETDRSGMVAGYMGQTAEKVNELVEKAMGGILFIDEAYALTNNKQDGDFGQEAVDTLLKAMEDKRDNLVVIVAGYPEPMEEFLDSNPGLRSRFNKHIQFEDYTASQLNEIFESMCQSQDYVIAESAKNDLLMTIGQMVADAGENFANAREVRNYFERVVTRQADRIIREQCSDVDALMTIEKEDL